MRTCAVVIESDCYWSSPACFHSPQYEASIKLPVPGLTKPISSRYRVSIVDRSAVALLVSRAKMNRLRRRLVGILL